MRDMKATGVEWIDEIPESWDLVQLGMLFSEHKKKNIGMQSENLLSLSYGNIVRKDINTSDGLLPESFEGYNVIDDGDIVLRLTDLQNDQRSLRVGLAYEKGIVTSAYVTLRKRNADINSKFYYYLIHSYDVRKGFYGMGAGVRQGLNYAGVKKIMLPFPSVKEQEAVVKFLDERMAKVNNLITNVQSQIDKLKAYKNSLITETVTKGLAPSVTMRDSGIEWMGDIPEHWEILALKYICSMQSGKNLISEQIQETGDYPVYGGNGLRGYFDEYNEDGEYLLVGRQGALCGNVHKVSGKFWATEHAVVTTAKDIVSLEYLYFLLVGMNLNQFVSPTAAQPGLAVGTILNIRTCLPPIDEQHRATTYLKDRTSRIEKLIDIKKGKIEKLELYKRAVIYEYVTGKKEVS